MVIMTADEAEEIARRYIDAKFSLGGNDIVTSVDFDGTLFIVSGHTEESDKRLLDWKVKVSSDGNVVAWAST